MKAKADKVKADAADGATKIIRGAMKALTAVSVVIDREAWLKVSVLLQDHILPAVQADSSRWWHNSLRKMHVRSFLSLACHIPGMLCVPCIRSPAQ